MRRLSARVLAELLRDGDVGGERSQRFVELAVADRRFVADAEWLIELSQPIDDGRAWTADLN